MFAELLQLFKLIDHNGNGTLERKELNAVFGSNAEEFLSFCDSNQDTVLSAEEFITGVTTMTDGLTDEEFRSDWLEEMRLCIENNQGEPQAQ